MHDAKDEAFWNQNAKLELPVLSLMALHGSVCLALRHPQNTGESRKMMVEFVKQAGRYLVDLGALTPDELINIERIEAAGGSEDIVGSGDSVEIRRISKNQLWEELEHRPLNFILFGGERLTFADEILAAYKRNAFVGAVSLSSVGEMNLGKPSIIGLLVLKAWRRQGIGTKLMERAINRMKERGQIPAHIDVLSNKSKMLIESLDDELKKCLVINDQSAYADCFDLFDE